jgi:hypothetical protein
MNNIKKFWLGLRIFPTSVSAIDAKGEMEVLDSGKLNFHNGTNASPIVTESHTATLSSKTLSSPVINTPTLNGSGGALTLPAGPDTLVGRATTDTLTNKTLTSPTINTPVINGSGGALNLPAGPDTLVGRSTTDTLSNKTLDNTNKLTIKDGANLVLQSSADNTKTVQFDLTGLTTGTVRLLALPNVSDTLVARSSTDTLTNKTISGSANTLSNIGYSSLSLSGSVVNDDISASASVSLSKLAALTASKVVVSDSSGVISAASFAPGDVILKNGSVAMSDNFDLGNKDINNISSLYAGVLAKVSDGINHSEIYPTSISNYDTDNNTSINRASGLVHSKQEGGSLYSSSFYTTAPADADLSVGLQIQSYVDSSASNITLSGKAISLGHSSGQQIKFEEFYPFTYTQSAFGSLYKDIYGDMNITAVQALRLQSLNDIKLLSPVSLESNVISNLGTGTNPLDAVNKDQLDSLLPSQTGNSGKFLQTDGASLSWQTLSASGYLAVVTVSSNTTLTNGDDVVLVNASAGSRTITLPSPALGKVFHIKKIDSTLNSVQVSTTSGLIDGNSSKILPYQYDSVTIVNNGTDFYLI